MSEGNELPFKKGDAVQHKTGGPKMIFVGEGSAMMGGVICTWMANGQKQTERFEAEELEPFRDQPLSGSVMRG